MTLVGGRADRGRVRQAEDDKSRALAEEFVVAQLRAFEMMEGYWAKACTSQRHDAVMRDILQQVVDAGWPQGKILAALSRLALRSRQAVQYYKLDAAPFQAPIIHNRLDDFRSEAAFHAGVAARAWDNAFGNALVNYRANGREGFEFWCGLALFSALARGGLLVQWQVGELYKRLQESGPWLGTPAFGRPVLHFISDPVGGFANAGTVDKPHLEWRFVPDGLTLALLSRANQCRPAPSLVNPNVGPEVAAYRLICLALFERKQRDDFRTLRQLCQSAAWLLETRKGVAMPRALLDIATGNQPTVPLVKACHDNLWTIGKAELSSSQPIDGGPTSVTPTIAEWGATQLRFLDMTRESLQLYTEDRRKISPRKAIQALLTQSICFEIGTIEHLLTVWLEYRINKESSGLRDAGDWHDLSGRRKRAIVVASALRYHNWISVPLLDRLAGVDLRMLSLEDFEDLYDDILSEEPNKIERNSIAGRLVDLHNFAAQHRGYQFPRLQTALLDQTRTVRRVRARTLSYPHYQSVRSSIRSAATDLMASDQYELVLVLAYRCGLRLGEIIKLRLGDIEKSGELTLFIRQNRYGSNKSHAARRKIASGLILSDDERALFQRALHTREQQRNLTGTFFQTPGTGLPFQKAQLSVLLSRVIRDVTGDKSWTFHHLRHSSANNALLAVLDADPIVSKLSGWDSVQQRSVKRAILRELAPQQHRFNSVAAFMGHASVSQTLLSYFHLAPELLADRTGRAEIKEDLRLYGEALNIPPSRIATCQFDGGIIERFAARWKKLTEKVTAKPAAMVAAKRKPAEPALLPSGPAIDQCLLFLTEIERGPDAENAAALVQVPLPTGERWLENARMVASLHTRQGNNRFFAKPRITAFNQDPERREMLLPGRPNPPHHQTQAKDLLNILWGMSLKLEREFRWWIDYALHHYSASKSRIRFSDPKDAARFVGLFAKTSYAASRWQIDLKMTETLAEPWLAMASKSGLRATVDRQSPRTHGDGEKMRGGWAQGHAELYLRETKFEKKPLGDRPKVNAAGYLGYCIHVLAVLTI